MSSRTSYNRFVKQYTNNTQRIPTYYNGSSTAPDYRPFPKEGLPKEKRVDNPTKTKKGATTGGKRKKKVKAAKRKPHKNFIIVHREEEVRGISALSVISFALIFVGLTTLLITFAMNKDLEIEISGLRKELQVMEDENRVLQAEISKNYDLAKIENIAIARLGMSKPKPYQIVHINVPVQSSVVQHRKAIKDSQRSGILAKANNFLEELGVLHLFQ